MFRDLMAKRSWGKDRVWLAFAQLLMTCERWQPGVGWNTFFDLPVLREVNDYKLLRDGSPNTHLHEANAIAKELAAELGISPDDVCAELGRFFKEPQIASLQPQNPKGNAFRSLVAEAIATYGDRSLIVHEEQPAYRVFPGQQFSTRSREPKIDIAVWRDDRLVALLTTRWTYRHDRVEIISEAQEYMPIALRTNQHCEFFGVTAEFDPARLIKVIEQSDSVRRNAVVTRLIHLSPRLAGSVRSRNGLLNHLESIEWLLDRSFSWR